MVKQTAGLGRNIKNHARSQVNEPVQLINRLIRLAGLADKPLETAQTAEINSQLVGFSWLTGQDLFLSPSHVGRHETSNG